MDSGVLLDQSASPQPETSDAAPAPEAARPSPAANLEISEDVFGQCRCAASSTNGLPKAQCFWCLGSGYNLVRRVLRPAHRSEFSEAATARIRTLEDALQKAANTIDHAAKLFLKLGHPQESAHTKAAAKALRGEGA